MAYYSKDNIKQSKYNMEFAYYGQINLLMMGIDSAVVIGDLEKTFILIKQLYFKISPYIPTKPTDKREEIKKSLVEISGYLFKTYPTETPVSNKKIKENLQKAANMLDEIQAELYESMRKTGILERLSVDPGKAILDMGE